ncbi:hypothetical protein BIFGAL_03215 [Bifidobacterium gallicum DSM 20093 = LMG 11596]|uniref:Uncharacterized protein n=1 Tax=Bifidobacterium gallicum DSM 20093 = LMG 11596 TaxID=561180 RepID=D1NTP8_9BIFI|nr:hypothetical protein BIFGAL_03215 [Bifidobacterium gallicum DSM 20093 = LMG 11596]
MAVACASSGRVPAYCLTIPSERKRYTLICWESVPNCGHTNQFLGGCCSLSGTVQRYRHHNRMIWCPEAL